MPHRQQAVQFAIALILASCAPVVVSPRPSITAPKQSAAASPAAALVVADAGKTAVVAAKLEGQVAGLQQSTATLRDGMRKAISEADRLRVAKAATEAELNSLYEMLKSSADKVTTLVAEVEEAWKTAGEQRDMRAAAEVNLSALTTAAAARDAETETLRLQHQDMATLASDQAKQIATMQDKLTAAEKGAAVGSYFKGAMWFIAIAIVLFIAARMFLLATIPKIP